jgi:hypothetical protein
MRRFVIFAGLGPPLGLATGMFVLLPLLDWGSAGAAPFDWHQVVLLPAAYFMGVVPALLAALVDHALARRQIRMRVLWTACAAFVVSFVPVLPSVAAGFVDSLWILPFGLVGAVPGAICSWLSNAFGPT